MKASLGASDPNKVEVGLHSQGEALEARLEERSYVPGHKWKRAMLKLEIIAFLNKLSLGS